MAKRVAVVCEHLEKVSRTALMKYQAIVKEYIRGRHGIYALYRKDNLYYVGLAINLRRRLRQHLNDKHGKSWDRFSVYLTIGQGAIKELESLVLRIVDPPGNSASGKFFKSANLRVRLKNDIRATIRNELDDMMGLRLLPPRAAKKVHLAKPAQSNGRSPVLAGFSRRPSILRARFKGKTLRARVRRDGSIRFEGKTYLSPSLAARAACRRPTCNGWVFWKYQRAPGDWVTLNALRS